MRHAPRGIGSGEVSAGGCGSDGVQGRAELVQKVAPVLDSTEILTSPSVTPYRASSSSLISECVVLAGWQARVSHAAEADRVLCDLEAPQEVEGARFPPRASKEKMPPGNAHWASRIRICSGSVNSVG